MQVTKESTLQKSPIKRSTLALNPVRTHSSAGVAGYAGFRRTNSEGAGARNNRAISLPHPSKGSLHPRLGQFTANTVTDGHRFPLLATPTSYAEDASAFQVGIAQPEISCQREGVIERFSCSGLNSITGRGWVVLHGPSDARTLRLTLLECRIDLYQLA